MLDSGSQATLEADPEGYEVSPSPALVLTDDRPDEVLLAGCGDGTRGGGTRCGGGADDEGPVQDPTAEDARFDPRWTPAQVTLSEVSWQLREVRTRLQQSPDDRELHRQVQDLEKESTRLLQQSVVEREREDELKREYYQRWNR